MTRTILLLFGLIQTGLQQLIILRVAGIRRHIARVVVAAALFVLLNEFVLSHISIPSTLLMTVWVLIFFLLYWLAFSITPAKSLLMAMGQLVLIDTIEYVYQFILAILEDIFLFDYENFYHMLFVRSIFLGILVILYWITHIHDFSIYFTQDAKHGYLAISLVFLLLFADPLITKVESLQMDPSAFTSLDLYSILLFFGFFVYNVFYMRSRQKVYEIAARLETQNLYAETVNQSLDELRGFKHEFATLVNILNGYISVGEWDAATEYVGRLQIALVKISNNDVVNAYLKQSQPLYPLLLTKLSMAGLRGVNIRLSFQKEPDFMYCDQVDYARIAGLLLDNAMDAAALEEDKTITVTFEEQGRRTVLVVSNPCGTPVEMDQIRQDGYSTKPGHTGVGLNTVDTLIAKYRKKGYDMTLQTTQANGRFTQVLTL
ncbi:GHKL domain-containing protein [Ruminococcaceae bacterium OttesenSCG-928-L11]|nr:GHKL domain-containing protein [Ruminococcaceae bacterium OttesenSCG-928-L11]